MDRQAYYRKIGLYLLVLAILLALLLWWFCDPWGKPGPATRTPVQATGTATSTPSPTRRATNTPTLAPTISPTATRTATNTATALPHTFTPTLQIITVEPTATPARVDGRQNRAVPGGPVEWDFTKNR